MCAAYGCTVDTAASNACIRAVHCAKIQQCIGAGIVPRYSRLTGMEKGAGTQLGCTKIFNGKASVVCQLVGSYFITVLADAQIKQVKNGRMKGRNECNIPVVIRRACRYRPLAVTQRISVRTGSIKGFSGMFHPLKGLNATPQGSHSTTSKTGEKLGNIQSEIPPELAACQQRREDACL